MYFFLDTLSRPATCIFFQGDQIYRQFCWDAFQKECDTLLQTIAQFFLQAGVSYSDIEGVVVLHGPGGFTGTRVTALTINTFLYVYKWKAYEMSYFSFLHLSGAGYPYAIQANVRECLVQENASSRPHFVSFVDLPHGEYIGLGNEVDFLSNGSTIRPFLQYAPACRENLYVHPVSRISVHYIKDPHITL